MQEAPTRISECTCPPWVERCAHFDGHAVRLINWWRSGRTFKDRWPHWHVCLLPELCDGTSLVWQSMAAATYKKAVALAAFHDAEERLLRGGD